MSKKQSAVSFTINGNALSILFFQAKPPGRPGVTAGPENDRSKQINEYKKKISHLKNIDSKLANHILDEIIERYVI